jgi:hypothetical protein
MADTIIFEGVRADVNLILNRPDPSVLAPDPAISLIVAPEQCLPSGSIRDHTGDLFFLCK